MTMRAVISRRSGPLDGIDAAFDRLDRGEVVRHVILM